MKKARPRPIRPAAAERQADRDEGLALNAGLRPGSDQTVQAWLCRLQS